MDLTLAVSATTTPIFWSPSHMKRPTHMRRFLKPALKRNRLFYSVLWKFKEQLAQQTAYSDSIRGKGGILRPSSDGGLIHLNHAMSHFETIQNGVRVFFKRRRCLGERQSDISSKIRPPVYIPLFNQQDEKHIRIFELAKQAGADAKSQANCLSRIQHEYLHIAKQKTVPYKTVQKQ